jgi:hypothetical protein
MNGVSKQRSPIAAALVIVGIAMAYSAPSFADSVDDELLAMESEFEIGNGDSKIIADHNTPEPYRVCVAKGPNAVPVRARYDGQERTISVGGCSNLTAKVITLSPASRINEDAVLIGKYAHLKK